MKRFLLALALLLGGTLATQAQCVSAGGVNSVPQYGLSCDSEPSVASYGATSVGLVPASAATDVVCITGSATKVVRVQYIRVSGSAGTLINVPITITKHASANTGGTAATSTALPVPYTLDTTNATVSATITAYTANPTIADATPGILDNDIAAFVTTGTASTNGAIVFDYTGRNFIQAPILRGVAQQICVNFNATSVSSGVVNTSLRWTEAAQ